MILYLVPKLDMNDVPSPDQIRKMIENFLSNFADRYPGSGPIPYIGPLDEALKNSLFDTTTVSDFFRYTIKVNCIILFVALSTYSLYTS